MTVIAMHLYQEIVVHCNKFALKTRRKDSGGRKGEKLYAVSNCTRSDRTVRSKTSGEAVLPDAFRTETS